MNRINQGIEGAACHLKVTSSLVALIHDYLCKDNKLVANDETLKALFNHRQAYAVIDGYGSTYHYFIILMDRLDELGTMLNHLANHSLTATH